jgi:hypothetical protein|tara:strand:- start:58 stop:273 length:216 start_codon:yes stop_codon:yes gene_type:complete
MQDQVQYPFIGKVNNHMSHFFGIVDEVTRCLSCDVAGWNGWKEQCPMKEQRDLDLLAYDAYKVELEGMGGR